MKFRSEHNDEEVVALIWDRFTDFSIVKSKNVKYNQKQVFILCLYYTLRFIILIDFVFFLVQKIKKSC